MDTRPVLCAAIDEIANGAGLTDDALAQRAGLERSLVNRIRNGKRFPSGESLQALADALPGRSGRVYSLASQIANERAAQYAMSA